MPLSILYLLKLSISLSVIWLFYQLMLRRLTFYNLNRWYLLGYSLLSFIIPLVNIGSFLEEDALQGSVIQYIPQIGGYGQGPARELSLFARLGPQDILWGVLLAGSGFLLIRLLIRWFSLRQVRRRGRLISDAGVKVFQVDQPIRPFSFGSAIYINPQLHTEKEYSAIILHEYVHIRQRHTVDILLSELICIVNWYNPFVWLIRRSIRQNLEFIADRKVLEKGLDKKGYQYHLLQVVGVPGYSLATNFNFSSLKKRIVMMNKIKSTRIHLLKFLFLAPMLAVLLLVFREKIRSAPARISSMGNVTGSDTLRRDTLKLRRDMFKLHLDTLRLVLDSAHAVRKETLIPLTLQVIDTLPLDSAKPLFIIDGVQMEKNWRAGALSPDDIQSVDVIQDRQAVALFGAKGRNGVVAITTKKSKLPASAEGATLKVFPLVIAPSGRLSDPLYYKDGVEVAREELKTLNPGEIEYINVLKGDSAVAPKYGEKGRNDVILIRMKKKLSVVPGETMEMKDNRGSSLNDSTIRISGNLSIRDRNSDHKQADILVGLNKKQDYSGIFILDDKEISRADLEKLDIEKIKAINVLKGESAVKQYGERGRQGVIVIQTQN